MNGVVKVTSQENVGSVFSMVFSAMCKLGVDQHSPASSVQISIYNSENCQFEDSKNKPTMLFVNDDVFLLFTYKEQLSKDFRVEQAENGMQAL
jgi:hypothetical protein